ncbi:exodeoxyribonuclease VII large subunit [Sphingomicrobium lutaoense]|uniref:Exodeoxyribonuclease 7 large subunit n=1 Tax=Sphingomicrobium lutaoense TaxID=515949 RepID=A0A839Z1P3_9SPHN|nr:exodeoxyribonuclease VII large subunit [Sphingomicrobium lutaoense]MBB3764580.1 exodeoxyribonuclease VII large subunit [Sphingomicrobium lutaoense]
MVAPEQNDRADQPDGGLLAKQERGDNAPALSVSELSGALKRTVEGTFAHVRVRGEISGWKRAASGHCYFTLKDENSCLDAVLWRGQAGRLAFQPEDGAEVVATGKITTYPGRSKYQISVASMELAGEGALMALLDRRRKALAAEGLFAPERKRELPYFPRVIGVITSPTGAVIRDILHRLEDRCPTHVLVWPVPVQGEAAAPAIAAAIRGMAALTGDGPLPRPDLMIVARGGGSIEDLWAFNEEVVVRAAADCTIPLISAVGHETDTTLIDHAADKRAPTPTAAAEMAVPVRRELVNYVGELGFRAGKALGRGLDRSAERLGHVAARLPSPLQLIDQREQRVDDLGDRLSRALGARAQRAHGDLAAVAGRLDRRLIDQKIHRGEERLAGLWRLAQLAHPDKPLSRGYARITDGDGRTLTRAADAREAARLSLHFADGQVHAVPEGSEGAGSAPRKTAPVARKPRKSYRTANQPGLFDAPGDSGDE